MSRQRRYGTTLPDKKPTASNLQYSLSTVTLDRAYSATGTSNSLSSMFVQVDFSKNSSSDDT